MPPLQLDTMRHPARPEYLFPASNKTMQTVRKQRMTNHEQDIFQGLFHLIFNAASEQEVPEGDLPSKSDPLSYAGIGRSPEGEKGVSHLLGKVKRQAKKQKSTREEDEFLDRKKEEMEMCTSDQALLQWAMREVFDKAEQQWTDQNAHLTEESKPSMLESPAYPHLVSHLMRTFRDKYHDPHLAFSIFEHARLLSIASYVFGCTTPAYNQLIETRWKCFRDLRGVCDALEEMKVNGVQPDNRTATLVEGIRRELGERSFWQEDSEIHTGEVSNILNKMESLARREPAISSTDGQANLKLQRWTWRSEEWRLRDDASDDQYEFGRWDTDSSRHSRDHHRTPARQSLDITRSRLTY